MITMDKKDIIKYQLPNEIIKYIHKKKDIYNILLVCRSWYNCGIKVLYRDFSYEYTLLRIPTSKQLEWVKHYHTWIDAAEEKRNFQLYTLIQGMKRLESIHIDIFGHIKYFKKYRKFLYKFAELKKDQIKTLHISLDILDDNISNKSLIKFKTIFTQFIKIFNNLDVLILETGEENPFVDIQRLMIECLTNVYDNNSNHDSISSIQPSHSLLIPPNENDNNELEMESSDEESEEEEEEQDDELEDDEGTIISEISTFDEEDENNESIKPRHMLNKLIIYDNNSINIEESLSDIISKIPLRQLIIRSYLPKHPPEPISSISRYAEPFWRINRYKREILSKYPEYFTSLALENQNSILKGNQFTDYESFCNRSKDKIWRKLYYVYYENLKKRVEHELSDNEDSLCSFIPLPIHNHRINHSSSFITNNNYSTISNISTISSLNTNINTNTNNDNDNDNTNINTNTNTTNTNINDDNHCNCNNCITTTTTTTTTLINSNDLTNQATSLLNNITTYSPKNRTTTLASSSSTSSLSSSSSSISNMYLDSYQTVEDQSNYKMESLCLENCQSISVKLFSIVVSKLSHLSTIKLDNISFLPEFCVLKLLIGSGKNLLNLELNMASHQLTPDIIVCIATENSNLNTLSLKSSDNPLTIDIETINWMLTLCHQLYYFRIENADENVHRYYKTHYNYPDSSFHQYKKTILNKTVINKIQRDTLINYEKLLQNL
ncbi:hypothetical protein BCR32DRAFT_292307 [Anaeromyces robustus]|uniref:F-box domain-containing protein n=1 Tax=Anaeromyces robustus TaxID=1754192 RepID=A0A1Y1XC12_9FUNG|nr:hypothetical protein BCR32DRAFT_273521 [Anaeromyces robustus]ORX82914.1 hypothetical protein BCR32DRAFT_292307 [Anaeromyces robustus]|eukprot:ORX62486.1 hypothetical protein BCR32DRAFT_273521 [Anaeromyces robustus]